LGGGSDVVQYVSSTLVSWVNLSRCHVNDRFARLHRQNFCPLTLPDLAGPVTKLTLPKFLSGFITKQCLILGIGDKIQELGEIHCGAELLTG
jgi:hypothetical protein